jgi:galactokinase
MNTLEITTKFTEQFKQEPDWIIRVPIRASLLGEYVGFDAGLELTVETGHSIDFAGCFQENNLVSIHYVNKEEIVCFSLDSLDQKADLDGKPLSNWALYPAGIAWALKHSGFDISGLHISLSSNSPLKAKLPSSGSFGIAFALLWQAADGLDLDHPSVARICRKAENEYVDCFLEKKSKLSTLCGVDNHAIFFDNNDFTWQAIRLPIDTTTVIFDTGHPCVLSSKIQYDIRASNEKAVALLKEYLPDIQSLGDIPPTEFAALSFLLPEFTRKHAEHVIKEIARVHSAVRALHRNDVQAFGALLYAGHKSLRDLCGVSIPEIDILIELSRQFPHCIGARLTGVEIGRFTINLVSKNQKKAFIQHIKQGYQRETGKEVQAYLSNVG